MDRTTVRAYTGKITAPFKKAAVPLLVTGLIALLIAAYTVKRVVYLVGPGEAGIHWSLFKGTEVDRVYGEGIRLFPPWDRFAIYNVRVQEIAPELHVLTKTGLRVHLKLSIRYRPQYSMLGVLHQQVGPEYVNTVVIPEVEAVLREIIGTMAAEEIYTTGRAVIIEAINQAIEQISQRYIDVDDVLIKRIILPESVAAAIREKIMEKHRIETKAFSIRKAKNEADRKRAEAAGIHDYLATIASAIPEDQILKWYGIKVTEQIATSNNAKVVIIGNGENGLPIILNAEAGIPANSTVKPTPATMAAGVSAGEPAALVSPSGKKLPVPGAMGSNDGRASGDDVRVAVEPAGQNTDDRRMAVNRSDPNAGTRPAAGSANPER